MLRGKKFFIFCQVGQLCGSEPSTPEPLEEEAGGSTPAFCTPPSSPGTEAPPDAATTLSADLPGNGHFFQTQP